MAFLLLAVAACGGGAKDSGGGFTLSASAISFEATEEGATPPSHALLVTATGPKVAYVGAGYRQDQSRPSWLDVQTGGTTGSRVTLQVSITSTGLPPGTYTAAFAVGTADARGNILETRDVSVTYLVVAHPPRLVASVPAVVLGGTDGRSQEPVELSFHLDSSVIAACDYAATASTRSGGEWLELSPSTGTVGTAGSGVRLAARPGLQGGSYEGAVRLACTAGGQPVELSVPVTLHVEEHRLVVGSVGVALYSAPSRSVLVREIPVRSSLGRAGTAWTASSDQPWLAVTASGTTPATLRLEANPSGLTTDQTHFAEVAVLSADPSVENRETIRVGLALRGTDASLVHQPVAGRFLAASPVEPLVFVASGGPDVAAFDVYTGAQVRTFAGAAREAWTLAVSGDGRRLFVHDRVAERVAELDAITGVQLGSHDASAVGSTPPEFGAAVGWVRPAGVPLLLTPSGRMVDLASGTELPDRLNAAPTSLSLVPSLDGEQVVTHTGAVYRLRRTALGGGRTWAEYQFGATYTGAAPGQSCLRSDGAKVYTAAAGSYFGVVDAATHVADPVMEGASYANSVACLWNGLVVGGSSNYYGPVDLWVYDGRTASLVASGNSTGVAGTTYRDLVARGMAASADGTRLVTVVGSVLYAERRGMYFQSLPAPP